MYSMTKNKKSFITLQPKTLRPNQLKIDPNKTDSTEMPKNLKVKPLKKHNPFHSHKIPTPRHLLIIKKPKLKTHS
jgi:hypothetical protein